MSEPGQGSADLVRDALSYLAGVDRERSPEQLLAELRQRFQLEGRFKLGGLLYEIGQACVAAYPDAAVRTAQPSPPRDPAIVAHEVDTLRACLEGVDEPPDLSALVRTTPAAETALAALDVCVELLRAVEGRSGCQRILEAYARIFHGAADEAEALLRALLDDPQVPARFKPYARVNLALALLRQDRSAEALAVAEQAVAERPDNLPAHFCLVSSAADVGELELAERGLGAVVRIGLAGDTGLARSFVADELARMVAEAGLDGAAMQRMRAAAAPLLPAGDGA